MKKLLIILIALICFDAVSQNNDIKKIDKFISTHESCCGGNCGNNSYKMWKDGLICYIKTTKSIDYSIKELTDSEPLHIYTFVKNDKRKNIVIVKLKHENDSRSLQGFLCSIISK